MKKGSKEEKEYLAAMQTVKDKEAALEQDRAKLDENMKHLQEKEKGNSHILDLRITPYL